jgi:hypothetical protein
MAWNDCAGAAQILVERAAHRLLDDERRKKGPGRKQIGAHGQAAFAPARRAIALASSRVK